MSYQASIHHIKTGRFLMDCRVEGRDLRDAEREAICTAAIKSRALPHEMDVRHLHQCMECRQQPQAYGQHCA